MSQRKVEELADNVRRDCSIFKAPIPINDVAKMQGLAIQAFDFGDDVSGVLVVKDGKGTIGYNPQESIVRKRFTIAHELGHFLLHGNINEVLFVDKNFKVHFRDQASSTGELRKEREANAFAAAILMPREMLIETINQYGLDLTDENAIKELAKKFKVSSTAMTFRISNLGLL